MTLIKQYDILLVNLDPTIGVEMKKTRRCVVLSPDEMNRHLQTIVIAPVTGSSRAYYPTRVPLQHETTKGWIVIDQIRTIDRSRAITVFGSLSPTEVDAVKAVLKETFVD